MSEDNNKKNNKIEEEQEGYVMKQPFNPNKIKVRTQTITIDAMVEKIRHGKIDLSTKFQRNEGLWSEEQQSRLIESILIRFPLPVFYFDGSDYDKWLVIDGVQRLFTLRSFMVSKDLKLTGLEFLSLNNRGWDDLDRPQQRQINETQLQCYVLEEAEDDIKFHIFKRINTGGLTLSSQEIRHAMHQGIVDVLEEMAESQEFLQATGNKISSDRMQDRDFVNRFLAFYLLDSVEDYSKDDDLDSFMNNALSKLSSLNKVEIAEILTKFKSSMSLAFQIFGKNCFSKKPKPNRINKALFEVVSVSFAKIDYTKKEMLLQRKDLFKEELYLAIKNKFKDSLSSGTGGQSSVHLRHREFNNVVNSVLS